MRDVVIRIGGRRYRYVGRRKKIERTPAPAERITAIGGRCPRCGSEWLRGDGDPVIRYRTTRYPVWCERCGARAVMAWPTSPALRDLYCAERVGVDVATFRRYRDAARKLWEDDRHGA
ncbi:hypothetical protein Tmar_0018 [Thermaerobacter marianensis DSM 12885]|uniref:Uncharacterized protein n=1 Tax=Thermaerobacter marianensis (strain ATCC 700841 / DSM 12885 / JCM 10246 / 7p75a) TaxID=644966 RepID=E6SKF6_THEM7|nr:hypothetical protein [Thermaerobacter marianensis]ADU50143.1 hypothetical protein Tmar_0018 [Thermaerobacter marianensis DSM 12885]